MSAIASWCRHPTRRLHQQPFLARVDTTTSHRAAEMAQEAVVINMGDDNNLDNANKDKNSDTLFGPNIGIVSCGPAWTERHEKTTDELTPEIVKSWISRSKENFPSTTTLQALVNLKRPTLRLTPLEIAPSDDPDHIDSQHHHGLEFEYDCDAPKCGISVHVLLSPKHRLSGKPDASGLSRLRVFESVVEGGFGKVLKLEEGATLELGRFEHRLDAHGKDHGAEPSGMTDAEDAHPADSGGEVTKARKRFTHFNFRKRVHDRSIAGPALAVVDAEMHNTAAEGDHDKELVKDEEADVGVRVTIRLSALDEDGKELSSVNEQVTYLHIVRFGPPPPAAVEGEPVEDNRPWVVKVVKREATIGPHTFHLHEIYGLSANSTTATQQTIVPASPTALDQHVYPPVTPPATVPHEEEPSSECLLCLSSPREVVLLPCRHLVACRDCALNMIEFGAGGTIHQESETNATPGTEGANGENANAGPGAGDGAPLGSETNAPQPAPRRKRKAKGWSCPVCRQPYTSLLRITTTPPSKEKDDNRESASLEDHVPVLPSTPVSAQPTSASIRSSFASLARPGFLRFGRAGAPQPDIERAQPPSAAAA
ncbi:hypothetical protein AcV7_002615 [Taiwanofungus camphoratus]|nr:hypothetical protein AcV7_002615 [Antrodia cinnamomea]